MIAPQPLIPQITPPQVVSSWAILIVFLIFDNLGAHLEHRKYWRPTFAISQTYLKIVLWVNLGIQGYIVLLHFTTGLRLAPVAFVTDGYQAAQAARMALSNAVPSWMWWIAQCGSFFIFPYWVFVDKWCPKFWRISGGLLCAFFILCTFEKAQILMFFALAYLWWRPHSRYGLRNLFVCIGAVYVLVISWVMMKSFHYRGIERQPPQTWVDVYRSNPISGVKAYGVYRIFWDPIDVAHKWYTTKQKNPTPRSINDEYFAKVSEKYKGGRAYTSGDAKYFATNGWFGAVQNILIWVLIRAFLYLLATGFLFKWPLYACGLFVIGVYAPMAEPMAILLAHPLGAIFICMAFECRLGGYARECMG